jgi:hypothetical protein
VAASHRADSRTVPEADTRPHHWWRGVALVRYDRWRSCGASMKPEYCEAPLRPPDSFGQHVHRTSADAVFTFLDVRLSQLRPRTLALLATLVDSRGEFESADAIALNSGFRNRHQITYLLRAEGLPPLQRLAAWIRVFSWLSDYERTGVTLCRSSLDEAKDPASRYRLVKRVTGEEWSIVRARGLIWLLEEFLAKYPCSRFRGSWVPSSDCSEGHSSWAS